MSTRVRQVLSAALAAGALAGPVLHGQSKAGTARTPDGRPDLSGYWTNATVTPLERPKEFAGREFLTEAEATAYEKKRRAEEDSQPQDDIHYDNVIWQTENYTKGVSRHRSAIVVDPPDGGLPALTAAGRQRVAAIRRNSSDSADTRTLGERCISRGNEGPPMLGSNYNANLQILQTLDTVAIRHEMVHSTRIIRLDGSPHPGPRLRQLGGDSRGRWEDGTLVVDSTNFTDDTNFRAPSSIARQDIIATSRLHVIERFKRTDAATILYTFTVEDPEMWVRPWSGELEMKTWEGPIYEYGCHEGNYGLAFILSAARVQERAGRAAHGND